jgi:hypothetical protein
MNDLIKRRLATAEARFERYSFGAWEVEEAHHWHVALRGNELCRTVLFCADTPGGPCVRGHFLVRFQPGGTNVDECYAMIDGCSIGKVYPATRRKSRKQLRPPSE